MENTVVETQEKIVSLNDLAGICRTLKSKGKKIAMCHGCFDLLHPGHFKHFEAAKKLADVLIVTVTPDHWVKKGPGRPVFNQQIRMETLAALQVIDFVALNEWETAINTINLLQPDFYVKGQDYRDRSADITKNISLEEEAVKKIGGRMEITEEIQFSSSKLINAHMSRHKDEVQDYMTGFKSRFPTEVIIDHIDQLKDIRVLIIGDTIIDEYHYCTPLGKSSKSPTISTLYKSGESFAGGVLAIANHITQFTPHVELVTLLGEMDSQEDLVKKKLDPKITSSLFYRPDGPTNTKRRYLDTYLNIKLFEVTFMNDKRIGTDTESKILEHLKKIIHNYDMVLISDFGHGLITPDVIRFLESSGKFLAVNAQTNSNNYGYNYITKFRRIDYISIDEKELRLPFGDNYGKLEDLIKKLSELTQCRKIQITLGAEGAIYYDGNEFTRVPAFATSVVDSVGAGDAVLSVTSLLAYKNSPSELIPFIGNCTGAMAVEIIGNKHPVYRKDLLKYISYFVK